MVRLKNNLEVTDTWLVRHRLSPAYNSTYMYKTHHYKISIRTNTYTREGAER